MIPGILKIIGGLIWAAQTLTFASEAEFFADIYLFQTVFGVYVVFDGWTDVLQASALQRLKSANRRLKAETNYLADMLDYLADQVPDSDGEEQDKPAEPQNKPAEAQDNPAPQPAADRSEERLTKAPQPQGTTSPVGTIGQAVGRWWKKNIQSGTAGDRLTVTEPAFGAQDKLMKNAHKLMKNEPDPAHRLLRVSCLAVCVVFGLFVLLGVCNSI